MGARREAGRPPGPSHGSTGPGVTAIGTPGGSAGAQARKSVGPNGWKAETWFSTPWRIGAWGRGSSRKNKNGSSGAP